MFSTETPETWNPETALELSGAFGTVVPEPLMEAAEQVRGWFVLARGGAPFLSASDGRLLVEWLEAGIAVSAILRAIEAVSERRQARRTRTPFHLAHCAATLRNILKGKIEQFSRTVEPRIAPADGEAALVEAARQRLDTLRDSDGAGRLNAACQVAREFHEALWDLLKPQHPAMIAAAAADLADLAELLGESGLARAAEERARTRTRERYPELSITHLCEEFDLGVA